VGKASRFKMHSSHNIKRKDNNVVIVECRIWHTYGYIGCKFETKAKGNKPFKCKKCKKVLKENDSDSFLLYDWNQN
jgi:transcription initiation factor IIE alpha subunit